MICYDSPVNPNGDQAKQPCVLVLGFFDGVHLAHQHIINSAKKLAIQENMQLAVMTFFPHPKEVLDPREIQRPCMTPLSLKIKIFEQMKVDALYVIRFDKEFSSLAPAQFVSDFILPLNPKHIVAGFDFTYGKYGRGNMDSLRDHTMGQVNIVTIEKLERHGQKIGSTLIRQLIQSGKVDRVPDYLGDYYTIHGSVSPSQSKFFSFKVKTSENYMFPHSGLYQIAWHQDEYEVNAACLIDADSPAPKCLVKLPDKFMLPPAYGSEITVKFITKINGIYEMTWNHAETSGLIHLSPTSNWRRDDLGKTANYGKS